MLDETLRAVRRPEALLLLLELLLDVGVGDLAAAEPRREEHQPRHDAGVRDRRVHRDPGARRVPDEGGPYDPQVVQERVQVVVVGPVAVAHRRAAVAPRVVADDAPPRPREPGELLVPHAHVEHSAVQQHQHRPAARGLVVQLAVLDRHPPALHDDEPARDHRRPVVHGEVRVAERLPHLRAVPEALMVRPPRGDALVALALVARVRLVDLAQRHDAYLRHLYHRDRRPGRVDHRGPLSHLGQRIAGELVLPHQAGGRGLRAAEHGRDQLVAQGPRKRQLEGGQLVKHRHGGTLRRVNHAQSHTVGQRTRGGAGACPRPTSPRAGALSPPAPCRPAARP